ncbi:MAG: hypothetical protein ACI97N_002707 [Cognaticolwellia sp.]
MVRLPLFTTVPKHNYQYSIIRNYAILKQLPILIKNANHL